MRWAPRSSPASERALPPDAVVVDLPSEVRTWLVGGATDAGAEVVEVGGAINRRLLGPIDLTADHDDPLLELQRQMAVEGPLNVLAATAMATELSEDDAEQWIRALQIVLAAAAARFGLHTEDDVDGLSREDHGAITTIQAIMSLLMDALDR